MPLRESAKLNASSDLSADNAVPRHAALHVGRVTQLQRLVGNRAVVQMLRAGSSSPAGGVIQRQPSYRLPKEDDSGKYDEFNKSTYSDKDLEDKEGSDGKFTAVQADKNMPTFFGALKRIFGDKNVNEKKFDGTRKELRDAADRPHSVTANIEMQTTNKEMRKNGPLATAIGHFGYEQLDIQEGEGLNRAMDYNGGHLVGYQVLGGEEADQEWNIAPQDENNNKFAYNNTIEEMARSAKLNTSFDYTVELTYNSLNFEVDQNQLLQHGYIKKQDDSKPWNVQLPTRIPQHWSAKAVMNGNKGSFGAPTVDNESGPPKKSYEQYSQELHSDLSHDDYTHTARYMLTYENDKKENIPVKDVNKKLSDIRSVHYRMHQEQPDSIDKSAMPIDWKGGEKSDFGSVEKEQITAELVSKLQKDIEIEMIELENMSEITEEEFNFNQHYRDHIEEIAENENIEQLVCFGMLVHAKTSDIQYLKYQNEDCERKRELVLNVKDKLVPAQGFRKKLGKSKFDSSTKSDELSKTIEEMNTHSLNVKRAKVQLGNYNESYKKRKLEEDNVINILDECKKKAKTKHKETMKEDWVRKSLPSVFDGQRLSMLNQQPFTYYNDKVVNFFSDFPLFAKKDPSGITEVIKMEEEEEDDDKSK